MLGCVGTNRCKQILLIRMGLSNRQFACFQVNWSDCTGTSAKFMTAILCTSFDRILNVLVFASLRHNL